MKIALLGDVALNGLFVSEPDKNSARFKDVVPLLKNCSMVIANLETPLSGNGKINTDKPQDKGVFLHSDINAYKQILPALNLSVVSLANNHVYDYRIEGVIETIDHLKKLGIAFTGAGYKPEHLEPVIAEKGGRKIGVLAYVHQSTNLFIPENSDIFINYVDEEKICSDIANLKGSCDDTIVSIHWGVDYSSYPTKHQRTISKRFIEAGADIIHGHHTHTLQPYEMHENGIIFYSLGSFCFGDYYKNGELRSLSVKTKKSIIAFVDLQTKEISAVPIKELKGNQIAIRKTKAGITQFMLLNAMKIKHKNKIVDFVLDLKEVFFDRLYDYFFGYYRNPVAQMFSLKGFRKICYFGRDYRRIRSKK